MEVSNYNYSGTRFIQPSYMPELKRFPFIIKSRHIIIHGSGYKNALDRALTKFPNKYIKTKHAKNMDLINAQKQAKDNSKLNKGQMFYVILNEDEFEVKDFMQAKETDDVYSIWRDGAKVDSPNGTKNKTENENLNQMKTKKEKVAKKSAPSTKPTAPAKKLAPKKVVKKDNHRKESSQKSNCGKEGFG